tara:strand:+ start:820 stop:1584 length:765 start_codon:yes stop_codon:yes gene_type:complete
MSQELERLISIVKKLRAPDGCDWDNVQTSQTLTPYLLEEVYEVIEAIELKDKNLLKEELGDLLLHVIFQTEIANEENSFTLSESINHVSDKLISRHPHIFNNKENKSYEKENWELSKQNEKKRKYILDGVPINLPALTRARRIQEKAASVGFDWKNVDQIFDKVHEEIDELKQAIKINDKENAFEEIGDTLFSIVNVARFLDYDSESALRSATRKFQDRFNQIENYFKLKNKSLKDCSSYEFDKLWEDIKKKEI